MKSINTKQKRDHTIRVRLNQDELNKLNRSITENATISMMVRQLINNLPTRTMGEKRGEAEDIRS